MDFLTLLQRAKARPWIGYAAALGLSLLASLVRTMLGNILVGYPFITFFLVVVAVALIGTPGAAIFATILSALLASRFAVDSGGSVIPQSASAWVGLSFFLIVSAVVILLVRALSATLVRLNDARGSLTELNEELEKRVLARTEELTKSNALLISEAAAREAAEAQARQSQKMDAVGQLTGGIAHDFNNMLAIIIGALDLIKVRLKKGSFDIAKPLDNAMDGAQRAATLTRRLLAFSRQQALSPSVIDANALVRGMEEMLRRSLGERTELEFVLAGGLWRTKVDPGQLENAILNLAVNARDAMPDGGKLTVETMNAHLDDTYIRSHSDVSTGQYIVIAVSDSGTGMSNEVVERAFDPFYTTKPAGEGTGLGLSQVHGFVKQSGGHVKIYTEAGQGTTVKIYLRREHAGAIDGPRAGDGSAEPTLPTGAASEIILVVEDDGGVRRTSVDALRELGYTVRHASSGKEALEILDTQSGVTLLFTDVVMPGMTGRQLVEAIEQRQGAVRVVYTSGYTSNAIVHNGIIDSGVALLSKPFTLEELARKIRKAIDSP